MSPLFEGPPKALVKWAVCMGLVVNATVFLGCNSEQLNKMVEDVKSSTEAVKQEVQKVVPVGSIKLSIGSPIETSAASCRFMVMGDGRENVLQIRSGASNSDSYPSVLFQGLTTVASLNALAGEKVSGQLFVQTNGENGLWQNEPDGKCSIRILSIQETELIGDLEPTTMVSAEGKSVVASGSFRAVNENP